MKIQKKLNIKYINYHLSDEKEMIELKKLIEKTDVTARVIDLVAPIGKGQRSLIVAPLERVKQ